MSRLFALVFALGLLAVPVLAQEVGPDIVPDIRLADPEIEAVIGSQIDAFEADDFATAFTFASPTIQRLFGSADTFGLMVRRGYPMVWRPGEVRFLELEAVNGGLRQRVEIIDMQGVRHHLGYSMIRGETGWKINGVEILRLPDVAV